MKNRIRYVKINEHTLTSKYIYESKSGSHYEIFLDLKEMTYKIKNIKSNRVYRGGENINSERVLKRAVKKRLSKLGVVFEYELRDQKKEEL